MDSNGTPRKPVTATITQRIDPKCEKAYEALLVGIHDAAKGHNGFLSREIHKHPAGPSLEYTHVIHFDSAHNLTRWQHSPERQEWVSRMEAMAVHSTPFQVVTGLETWFTVESQGAIVPPPRYKMAIVTWLAIFPLITIVSLGINATGADIPILARTLVTTLILVPLMTYVVMPRMTWLFRRWLYPKRDG